MIRMDDPIKKKTVPSPHGGGTVQSIIHEKTLFRESLFYNGMVLFLLHSSSAVLRTDIKVREA